jgi:hypothetical protein
MRVTVWCLGRLLLRSECTCCARNECTGLAITRAPLCAGGAATAGQVHGCQDMAASRSMGSNT